MAYLVTAALVVVVAAVATSHGEWVSDSWIHLGAIRAWAADLRSPPEPLVGVDATFPYYSPWTLLMALLVKGLGLTAQQVLAAAGVVSPVLLVLVFHRLVRSITTLAWAPVAALIAVVTVWGTTRFFWSGFLSLNTLSVGSSWPSVAATALWFALWSMVWKSTDLNRGRVAALLLVPGLLLLVHPFTFICAATSCAITATLRWHRKTWLPGGLLALGSVGLAALWPWTSLGDLLSNPRGFDAFHVFFYQGVLEKFGLLLLALPAVVLRLKSDRRDPLVWCTAAGVVIWVLGDLLDVQSLGRVLPLATTSAALAMGIEAARALERPRARAGFARPAGWAVLACWAVAVALGAPTQANAWSRVTPDGAARRNALDGTHLVTPYPRLEELWARVPRHSVVLAPSSPVSRQLPAHLLYSVAPQWPSPGVVDAPGRTEDQAAILGKGTPDDVRARLLSRYHVKYVVWPKKQRAPGWLEAAGSQVAAQSGQVLYRLG